MSLRLRLAVTLIALTIPFAIALSVAQVLWLRRAAVDALAEATRARMLGALERCEAAPERWPGRIRRGRARPPRRRPPRRTRRPGRGPRPSDVLPYDLEGRSARPGAPPLDPALVTELRTAESAWVRDTGTRPPTLVVATRVADSGPCAIVAVRRPVDGRSFVATLLPTLAVSAFAVLLAVLAASPVVRRIRRLTTAVRRAREGGAMELPREGADEIGELARAFAEDRAALQAQMDALAQRDATLTAFVANTTHDVMIPLTVLQGHLVGLRRRLEDGSTEQELAELALEESDYLGALMQNLGAAARLDARDQPLELGPVDLGALVERVMTRHAPIAAQKGVQIDHAVPPTPLRARGDLTLLERLVGNLVHNAVRYNREGGHVAVVLEATEGGFTLRVLDDGPGVTPEELPRLGERRFRSEAARTRQPGGSGLGLAIARDVAERHGFALRFEANAPQGLAAILSGPRLDGSEPGSEAS